MRATCRHHGLAKRTTAWKVLLLQSRKKERTTNGGKKKQPKIISVKGLLKKSRVFRDSAVAAEGRQSTKAGRNKTLPKRGDLTEIKAGFG